MSERVNVAVVGLGAMGANALWRLAERGVSVVGFEQFQVSHPLGSSHGVTRLFREACLEHPDLTPIAQLSKRLFRELEDLSGQELLRITGGVMLGAPDSDVIAGTRAAASVHGLQLEELDAAELATRFPLLAGLAPTDVAVLDPGAGVAFPEPTIRAAVERARALGATVLENTRVLAIEPGEDGVVIRTASGQWLADRVILAQGAWLAAELPWVSLQPIRTPMTWFEPAEPADAADFGLENLPVFVRQLSESEVLWGHGSVGAAAGPEKGALLKAGIGDIWQERVRIDPDELDRGVKPADWRQVSELLGRAVPGIEPLPARVDPCMVTISPDDQFVVGPSPRHPRVIVGGGDSGHAFKHGPALGEILARFALDEPQLVDTAFIDPARFA
ncbi:N-methyl-L-tryptophan oxidase [Microterricola pindariensis]|nr:N-methyl-L-tryptophan oxidase [Microterricola pindariensis]